MACRTAVRVCCCATSLACNCLPLTCVITGEGRFDAQTLRGKTPFGVASIARAEGVPVVVLAGTLGEGYQALYEHGINAAFAIASGPMTLQDACTRAAPLLTDRARDIARLLILARS